MRIVVSDGEAFDIGTTEAAPTISLIDYSRRETDEFGVTTVVERGFSRRLSVRASVASAEVDGIQRLLAELRATAVTWIADEDLAWLRLRGYYRDFTLDLAVPPTSYCTLTIEGLAETEAVTDPGGDPAPEGLLSSLQMLRPVEVTDAVLSASTVAENDAPTWAPGTSYPQGAKAVVQHRVYESLIAGNVGQQPATNPDKWLDTGPTNRWAMFDLALGTQTEALGSLSATLSAGLVTAVALLDVDGLTVRVQANGYDRTQPVVAGALTFLDLPGAVGSVTITVTGQGVVSVGTLLIGTLASLGVTEASPTAGITDYSRKEVDDFGEVTVVQRAWAKRMTARALIRTDAIDVVADRLAGVRARPALWIGQSGMDCLTVYGFFKEFSIEAGATVSKLSLSIEGLSQASTEGLTLGKALELAKTSTETAQAAADAAQATADDAKGDALLAIGAVSDLRGEVLADIADVRSDLGAATDRLAVQDKVDAARDAAMRQAEAGAGAIAEGLLRALTQINRQTELVRDAGVYIDPATGQVRIAAVDRTAERVSEVAIALDGVSATLQLKATTSYVDQKIAQAVLDPSQIAQLDTVFVRLTAAEVGLDGARGSLLLKADATTVTALSGVVTNLSQGFDALTGVVTTKADRTEVTALGTRVGLVEQSLGVFGDVVGIRTEIRQATYRNDQSDEALLRALMEADRAKRGVLTQIALVQQELSTRIVDGDFAEAQARLILAAETAANKAALAIEQRVRTDETGALAQSLANLTAALDGVSGALAAQVTRLDTVSTKVDGKASAQSVSDLSATVAGEKDKLSAQITRLDQAIADVDGKASAQAVTNLTARVGDAEGSITEVRQVTAGIDGRVRAMVSTLLDANGRISGTVSENDGVRSRYAILSDVFEVSATGTGARTEYADGVWRVYGQGGAYMKAFGAAFGTTGQFVEWFGPAMALNQCSEANAISFEKADGSAYFGGTLSAGARKNAARSTSTQGAGNYVEIGPFGSAGGPRQVVVSYDYRAVTPILDRYDVAGIPTARIELERSLDGGATWSTVIAQSLNGTVSGSDGNGAAEPGNVTQVIGGSLTFTDTAGGTVGIMCRATLTVRTDATIRSTSGGARQVTQTLGVISTEG